MKKLFCIFLLLITGCSQVSNDNNQSYARASDSDYENHSMAYDNYINAEANEDKISLIYNDIYTTCTKNSNRCIVLNTNVSKHDSQAIHLKIKAEKAIIDDFINKIKSQSLILNQSISSENISDQIDESNRKLKFLLNYQTQLEQFKPVTERNIDSMLRLAKELAENQVKIDELKSDNSKNSQRIQMQTLSISLTSSQSFISPILKSLSKFKSNLSDGIAGTITFIAFLLPALVLLFLIILFIKRIKRIIHKAKNT